ncbi:hypothetical protein BV898_11947 [Hypsibius exemplaris]|uniref:SP-RING-type domain-containing protein n=1 Tax=Hypsibius exemplaris TaxID=2072580 RepID=A0A1W0WF67_HYPEX|nr:hypothetical protein BV898_11947 [Hypsibius exemplaris]
MAEEKVFTLKDRINGFMRNGHLEKVDKKVARKMFSDVSLNALKRLLREQYSVKIMSLSQKKAIDMCMTRFYKGSESSRQSAVRMFLDAKCVRKFLDRPEKEIAEELASAPITVLDGDAEEQESFLSTSNGSILETSSADSSQTSMTESGSEQCGLSVLGSSIPLSCRVPGPAAVPLNFSTLLDALSFSVKDNGEKMGNLDVSDFLLLKSHASVNPFNARSEAPSAHLEAPSAHLETPSAHLETSSTHLETSSAHLETPSAHLEAPCILGLAEPAFYKLKSCLIHFAIPCSAPAEMISHSINFDVPALTPEDVVLLSFRSVGSKRDTRQADHPVGLVFAVNDESCSSFGRSFQSLTAKLWTKKITVFDPPAILDKILPDAQNRLDLSFPRFPFNVNYASQYQGYIFVATRRTAEDVVKLQQFIPLGESLAMVVSLLSGPNGTLAPDKVSLPLVCPITFKPLQNPCRGAACDHPVCFEGLSYLQLYQSSKDPRWKCVICGEVVQWYEIRSDILTAKLAEEFSGCEKVNVSLDGTKLIFRGIPFEPETEDMDEK